MCACDEDYVCPACRGYDEEIRRAHPSFEADEMCGPPDNYKDGSWYSQEDADTEEAEGTIKMVVVDDTGAKDEIER
ncbi:MAG: hypothetical protein JW704_13225 [Anaerolineaceae bacterium]|nr:hypothetical protein [Anaerolineaceae bacterium]